MLLQKNMETAIRRLFTANVMARQFVFSDCFGLQKQLIAIASAKLIH